MRTESSRAMLRLMAGLLVLALAGCGTGETSNDALTEVAPSSEATTAQADDSTSAPPASESTTTQVETSTTAPTTAEATTTQAEPSTTEASTDDVDLPVEAAIARLTELRERAREFYPALSDSYDLRAIDPTGCPLSSDPAFVSWGAEGGAVFCSDLDESSGLGVGLLGEDDESAAASLNEGGVPTVTEPFAGGQVSSWCADECLAVWERGDLVVIVFRPDDAVDLAADLKGRVEEAVTLVAAFDLDSIVWR